MVELRKITPDNVKECLCLEVAEEQRGFVASNAVSLSQAFAALACDDRVPMPFAVYADGGMVGFIMLAWLRPKDPAALGKYYVWRLMIDRRFQGRGYGRGAMERALELIRTYPLGRAEEVTLSYEPDNHVARGLYASMGFRERGELDDGEQVASLKL